jgi:hypothetical protein
VCVCVCVCVCVRAWTSSEFLVQPFRLWQDEIPAHTHEDEEEVVPMQVRGQDVVAIYRQKDGESVYVRVSLCCGLA